MLNEIEMITLMNQILNLEKHKFNRPNPYLLNQNF